jgi:hypothetical protein
MACTSDSELFERALLQLLCVDASHPTRHAPAAPETGRYGNRRGASRGAAEGKARRPAHFFVVEVLSGDALSVCWSDAQAGRRGEQIWRAGFARGNAQCALSGKTIVRGDRVFRPTRSAIHTLGVGRMILASEASKEIYCDH